MASAPNARATPDLIYDQMVAAGCARKVIFSYMGNPGVGSLRLVRADQVLRRRGRRTRFQLGVAVRGRRQQQGGQHGGQQAPHATAPPAAARPARRPKKVASPTERPLAM